MRTVSCLRAVCALGAAAILTACAGGPRVYRGAFPTERPVTVAVLAPANLTSQPEAARVMLEQLTVELLRRRDIALAPSAVVDQALNELRIRDTGALTLDQTRALGEKLSALIILTGTVTDFHQSSDATGPLPVVSVNLRAVETRDGRVVWACAHSRTGSDTESVFGIGRVTSLPDLAATVAREMVATIPSGGH